jgi:hypothetical protein
MPGQRFSSLHAQNFNYLVILREASISDRVLACYEYGLTKDSTAFFAGASDEQLLHLAYCVDTSLCLPRYSSDVLCKMLETPPGVRAAVTPKPPEAMALARPQAPARADGVGSHQRPVKVSV